MGTSTGLLGGAGLNQHVAPSLKLPRQASLPPIQFLLPTNCADGARPLVALVKAPTGISTALPRRVGQIVIVLIRVSNGCGTSFQDSLRGQADHAVQLLLADQLRRWLSQPGASLSTSHRTGASMGQLVRWAGATVFMAPCSKLTATGRLTTLYSFCSLSQLRDGIFPLLLYAGYRRKPLWDNLRWRRQW